MATPETKVVLPPELTQFVQSLVAEGRYASADAAVAAGLRLLKDREAALADVRAKIQEGVDAARRGDVYDAEEVFDEIDAELREWEQQRGRKSA
jgi:antitoxin ParD1/3/4